MERKKIVIGCDNAAVQYKNVIGDYVRKLGYAVEDMGVDSDADATFYADVAARVSGRVADSKGEMLGILLCGTGIGMSICANKVPGVYAALCGDTFSAERAKLSNDANVLCMGSRVIGIELAKKITVEWLGLTYKDGPSTPKIQAMRALDQEFRK